LLLLFDQDVQSVGAIGHRGDPILARCYCTTA